MRVIGSSFVHRSSSSHIGFPAARRKTVTRAFGTEEKLVPGVFNEVIHDFRQMLLEQSDSDPQVSENGNSLFFFTKSRLWLSPVRLHQRRRDRIRIAPVLNDAPSLTDLILAAGRFPMLAFR